MRHHPLAAFVLAACAVAAFAQSERPGAPVVRINPPGAIEPAPSQPDPAYRPGQRDQAMAERPANGCSCESNNRCYHSLDFNYCVAKDGRRVYIQRFWGQ